jgi:xanthine dehydrogenase accessory factor
LWGIRFSFSFITQFKRTIMFDINEMASVCRTYLEAPDAAIALVTLVEKEGSSYRLPGARMLVKRDGSVVGTISGGCLEGDLATLAQRMSREGRSESIEVIDTRPVFGCHGTITVFVETIASRRRVFDDWMNQLVEAIECRRFITLETRYRGGSNVLGTHLRELPQDSSNREGCFIQPFGLRNRVAVVGAHGDVKPVLHLVRLLGWEAIQIVPGSQRRGWVGEDASGIRVEYFSPEELVAAIPPDGGTAMVVMTHNMGRDVSYAHALLKEPYPYVGMLGSFKRRNEVFEHLVAAGEPAVLETMDRLHCPIGLDIGSETQSEIAFSIVSEIKSVFSGCEGKQLKDKNTSIHPVVEIL